MKKKIVIFSLVFSVIIAFFYYAYFRNLIFIKNNTASYKIYTEKYSKIPIQLFKRNYAIGNEYVDKNYENELYLYIDEDVNMKIDGRNYEMLCLIENMPYIFHEGKNRYFKLFNSYLIESIYDYGASERFLGGLFDDPIRFTNIEEEPIKFFIVKNNTYKFNTFGGLKEYGDTIIIEKLDGIVIKEYEFYSAK